MTSMTILSILLFGVFFLLVFLNIPIAVSMGISSLCALAYVGMKFDVFANIMLTAIAKPTLLAIPYFILAGVIMEYGGISKRLIDFAEAMVGHRRGGLAIVVVICCCFFAAISGSAPATVAALGGVLIPAMKRNGYGVGFSSALLASAGAIGVIIPPSIAFVVFAMLTGASVANMFTAGIIPGILMGIAFVIASLIVLRKDENIKSLPKASGKVRWKTFKDAIWGLLSPIIILGGIYTGIFTPTEAAGVAVVYGLFVGLFVYKEMKMKDLWRLCIESAVTCATVMFILGVASLFSWILTTSRLAAFLSEGLMSICTNKVIMLVVVNVLFLIAGCFIDFISACYIFLPILTPILNNYNYSIVAFGVLMTVNFAIGQITPPVGIDLYVACNIAKIKMAEIVKHVWPFVIAGIIVVLLISFFPQISLLLIGG